MRYTQEAAFKFANLIEKYYIDPNTKPAAALESIPFIGGYITEKINTLAIGITAQMGNSHLTSNKLDSARRFLAILREFANLDLSINDSKEKSKKEEGSLENLLNRELEQLVSSIEDQADKKTLLDKLKTMTIGHFLSKVVEDNFRQVLQTLLKMELEKMALLGKSQQAQPDQYDRILLACKKY